MSILCVALFINLGAAIWRKKAEVSGAVMHMLLLFACLDLIYFFSLIDLLKPGMWASLAVVAAGSVAMLARDRESGILTRLKEYLDTGTVLNMFTSLLMFCIYFIRKPILYYWDETRLWGPMAAVTKAFDRLYTIGISITDSRAYPPGSALLNYFYTFFDRDYTDWGQLASYALLFIAVFSRTASVVEEKTGKKALASGVFLFLFLSPYTTLYHTITKKY